MCWLLSMNKRYKYLAKNVGLMTLSQFGTKLLSFFLVPLYTSILSTEDYGSFDLIVTTVNLLIPILTFNVGEGIIVFALQRAKNQRDIFSIGLKYGVIGSVIVFVLAFINSFLGLIDALTYNWMYLPVFFFLVVISTDIVYFVRGQEHVRDTAISGVLCSAAMIFFNILFLVVLKYGIQGYFWAYIIGNSVQAVYLFIRRKIWKYIIWKIDKSIEKEMLAYSKPLIFNSLSWWINSSSDRYIIIALEGVAANGIYSVGYKIPSILNIFQTIFASAWGISAVKDYNKNDSDGFFSNTYALYNCSITLICSGIVMTSRIIAHFLYAKDFFTAWQYAPFLTIAIIFGSLSGYLGGIFASVKDTRVFAFSTVIGSITNIVLNIILVLSIGSVGAAIATLISYFVIWLIRVIQVKKYIKIRINIGRDLLSYTFLIIQTVLLFVFADGYILYSIEMIFFVVTVTLYGGELRKMISKGRGFLHGRNIDA